MNPRWPLAPCGKADCGARIDHTARAVRQITAVHRRRWSPGNRVANRNSRPTKCNQTPLMTALRLSACWMHPRHSLLNRHRGGFSCAAEKGTATKSSGRQDRGDQVLRGRNRIERSAKPQRHEARGEENRVQNERFYPLVLRSPQSEDSSRLANRVLVTCFAVDCSYHVRLT